MTSIEKIFIHDDIFPLIKSDIEFEIYKKNHSEFDPEYILEHCYTYRQETRNWLESIWKKYRNYAEPDFLIHLRKPDGFHPFSWHMYLASIILEKNYKLQSNNGFGPDLQIKIGNKNVWIEAIRTTPGNDETAAGLPKSGGIYNGLDPRVARISNALTKKHKKYLEKYRNYICKEDEPFIIAINGSQTNTLNESRAAEATVYGRGNDIIKRMPNGKTKGGFYELRESFKIYKENKQVVIPANYFCNNTYKEISGIIYCEQHVINANNYGRTPEGNLYLLLNPYAKNRINLEEFKIGKLILMNKNKQIKREYEQI
ncbi:MAG: hypothetical protein HQ538_05950 [Parcubacteria group bacterium]|nr:hypothetical protein [Parcubacteria group bacterium]